MNTKQQAIRDLGGAIMALSTARQPDGSLFSYADILTAVGLPASRDWQRAVSCYLTKNGTRRRIEYTHKKISEDGGLLSEMEIDEITPEVETDEEKSVEISDALCQAIEGLANAAKALDLIATRLNLIIPESSTN